MQYLFLEIHVSMTSILIYVSIREISERQNCLRYRLYPRKKFGNGLCFNRPKFKNLHILQNYLCISETFFKINFYTHFLLLFNSSKTEFFSCIIVNLQKKTQKTISNTYRIIHILWEH